MYLVPISFSHIYNFINGILIIIIHYLSPTYNINLLHFINLLITIYYFVIIKKRLGVFLNEDILNY